MEMMDGLKERTEATSLPETQDIPPHRIICDSGLPAEVERDLVSALRTHLDGERFPRLDDDCRRRSVELPTPARPVAKNHSALLRRQFVVEANRTATT